MPTTPFPWGRTRPIVGAVAAVLLSSIALSACGASNSTTTGAAAASAHPAAGSSVRVASLSVKTIAGTPLTIPTGKPALIYFFTVNCGSCVVGAKNIGAALATAAPGAQVIAVDLDPNETNTVIHQFLTGIGNPPFTMVRDDGTLLRSFNATALGTTVVLDSAGKAVFRGVDPSTDQVAKALAAAAA